MGLDLFTLNRKCHLGKVDQFIKSAHFQQFGMHGMMKGWPSYIVIQIVQLHEISIDSVKQKSKIPSSYYHKTDGATAKVNQILENMLKLCVLKFQGKQENNLPLMEFAYNNGYQSTAKMAPLEAPHDNKYRTPYVRATQMRL